MPTRAGAEPGWSWEHNPVFPHGCFSSTALLEAKIRRPRLEPTQSSMGHWCPNSYLTTAPNASGERLPNTDVQGKINQLPDYNEKLLFKNPSCGERYSEHMYPVKDCYQWASARGGVQSVWLLLMRECKREFKVFEWKPNDTREIGKRHVWPLHEKGTPNGRQTWKGV